jgi:hypothetical protein
MSQIIFSTIIFVPALWLGCEGVIGLKTGVVRGRNNFPIKKIESPTAFWLLVVFDLVYALFGLVIFVLATLQAFGLSF